MTVPFLETDGLTMRFGGLTAVDGLSFKVEQGAIHGLIGPNGAGKTTTFNMISGFYKPTVGQVRLRGEVISGLAMYEVARRGVVRTFQHSTLFAELTVLENALVGTHMNFRPSILAAITGRDAENRRGARVRAEETLDFFGLLGHAHERAGDLPHGHQRALGLAVAMAVHPEVMLLDEPFTGLDRRAGDRLSVRLRALRDEGRAVVLVTHDLLRASEIADRAVILMAGRILLEASGTDLERHALEAAYSRALDPAAPGDAAA